MADTCCFHLAVYLDGYPSMKKLNECFLWFLSGFYTKYLKVSIAEVSEMSNITSYETQHPFGQRQAELP